MTQFQWEIVPPMNVSLPNKKEKKKRSERVVRRKKTLQISVPALLKQRETNRFIQRLKTHCTHVHTDKNPVRGKCQTWRLASKDKSISERISLAVNLAVGKTEKQARWVTHAGAQV